MAWPISTTGVIATEWLFFGLATLFVGLRVFMRNLHHGNSAFTIAPTDWIIVATLLSALVNVAVDTTLYSMGFKDPRLNLDYFMSDPWSAFLRLGPDTMDKIMKMLYASIVTFCLSIWGVKLYLIVLYYGIISPVTMPKQRILLHVVAGIVVSTFIVGLGVSLLWCIPVSRNWTYETDEPICINFFSYTPYLITVSMHIATEILIFSMPFSFLHILRRNSKKKFYAAAAMFSFGFFGVIISVCRMIYMFTGAFGSATLSMINTLARLEQCFGIIVCCLPAFKNLILRRRSSASNSRKTSGARSSQSGDSSKRRSVGPSEMGETSPIEGRGGVNDPDLEIMRVDSFEHERDGESIHRDRNITRVDSLERGSIQRQGSILSLYGNGSTVLGAQFGSHKLE
ncbi:hypothetical protein TWF694_003588 [Orbilia ellipsospora]|uniref:Rhodopsin domain-containing protein n=1 Tax=Orbilia ellipsospora TaxID=2528407 RepID=A0AAV9WZT3_9PEZI